MVKIIKRIIDIIFIIIIVLLSLYFILRATGVAVMYRVQTGSMETGIHVDDYIFVVRKNDYNVGDVITYKYENYYVTHRIIKKEKDKFVTKGDANNTEDEAISIKQVTGKVLLSGGLLNIIMNFKFTIIAVMLMIYLFTIYLNKKEKEKQEVKDEKITD